MNYEFLYQEAVQLIQNMILLDKIQLQDVPYSLRIERRSYYGCALRIARNISIDRYIKSLEILCNDINQIQDYNKQLSLVNYLQTYIELSPFNGDAKFERFKKNISGTVLP